MAINGNNNHIAKSENLLISQKKFVMVLKCVITKKIVKKLSFFEVKMNQKSRFICIYML